MFYPFFHPLGIKELAESQGLRTAYSIVNLLESIERGEIQNRLQALSGLKDEIINTAGGPMPKNTARVLLQIMKDLVRAKGNDLLQLQLAHNFRMAVLGKPRIVRKMLNEYHLLEMPEEWNQITFDDHVHDANTSGRKTPTHLIMDAWIKGIRRLRVIYYHYIKSRYVAELIEAARIMEIDLRIGIEFWVDYRDRFISFIWVSRGFPDVESFLCFLAEPHVTEFMDQGKAVLKFQEQYILHLLNKFNQNELDRMCRHLGIQMEKICPKKFLDFVFPGQPSLEYLAEYIHSLAVLAMKESLAEMEHHFNGSETVNGSETENFKKKRESIEKMECFTVIHLLNDYLNAGQFFENFKIYIKNKTPDVPCRLNISFESILDQIDTLHHDYRITLNMDRLNPEDVLELLYKNGGRISRIEIINLKKFTQAETDHLSCVNELQKSINEGSLLKLKRVILKIMSGIEQSSCRDRQDQLEFLSSILHDIYELKHMYSIRPLKLRIGSDSTGKPHQAYGMGFGIIDTLSMKAAGSLKKNSDERLILPVTIKTIQRVTYLPPENLPGCFYRFPGVQALLSGKKKEWFLESFSLKIGTSGNLVTLGKAAEQVRNTLKPQESTLKKTPGRSWKNLNTKLKNMIKIMTGFIPAAICFMLTKDWWFLAYFGAFIWFGITSIRNILQSVLGSGGIKRASLLKWNDYVSWDRLADSLLFTGFSVPLLDYLIKIVLLEKAWGINMDNGPVMLYAVMGLANGIYLSAHNFFRGLPKGAVTGNFFRSILAIPVAVILNAVTGGILNFFGIPSINTILHKWAAIISKTSSDIVAGVIEGAADRFQNTRRRKRDIKKKLSDLYQTYSRLALLFPEIEELKILDNSDMLFKSRNSEVRDLTIMIIINSLDLFYFWMYLPRAKAVMIDMVSQMTPEERIVFFQSQEMLTHEHHICMLFVDGILGKNFSRPLSFYLSQYKNYLQSIHLNVSKIISLPLTRSDCG